MGKTVRFLSIAKYFGLILGGVMYVVASESFGQTIGIALGVAAAVAFFAIVRKEETRQMGRHTASIIQDAIRQSTGSVNMVEIKRIRHGLIARIYVIGDADRIMQIQRNVSGALSDAGIGKRVWVLQVVSMDRIEQLEEKRAQLNEQLVRDLTAMRKGQ